MNLSQKIKEIEKFSWEKPIEEELLEFVRHMAFEMERVAIRNKATGWFANNSLSKNAENMAKAYRTVERHIETEIEIRSKVKIK